MCFIYRVIARLKLNQQTLEFPCKKNIIKIPTEEKFK